MKKFILSFIATFFSSWVSYKVILFVLVFLLVNVYSSIYLIYAVAFFLPLLIVLGSSIYFFFHKEREVAISIFIAGLICCLIFGYGTLITIGEMGL